MEYETHEQEMDAMMTEMNMKLAGRRLGGRPPEDEYLRPTRTMSVWFRADMVAFSVWLMRSEKQSWAKWLHRVLRATPEYKRFQQVLKPEFRAKMINPKWAIWHGHQEGM